MDDRARSTPTGSRGYARLCGWTLARAHARTGDRVAIAAYLGSGDSFDNALASFAEAYADTNDSDHEALAERGAERPNPGRHELVVSLGEPIPHPSQGGRHV